MVHGKQCCDLQVVSQEHVWLSSSAHRAVSAHMAELCSRGAMPCGCIDDSTPVTWQLVRGAAVADPQVKLCCPFPLSLEALLLVEIPDSNVSLHFLTVTESSAACWDDQTAMLCCPPLCD